MPASLTQHIPLGMTTEEIKAKFLVITAHILLPGALSISFLTDQ
jgi:hypothetical protein